MPDVSEGPERDRDRDRALYVKSKTQGRARDKMARIAGRQAQIIAMEISAIDHIEGVMLSTASVSLNSG